MWQVNQRDAWFGMDDPDDCRPRKLDAASSFTGSVMSTRSISSSSSIATHGIGAHRRAQGSTRRFVAYLVPLAGVALGTSVLVSGPAYAAQGPVGLGTAGSFAVLAGSGITNTGATTITGDVGTFPTPSETGFGSITLHGTNHHGDAVTKGAKTDLTTAYNDAAGRKPVTSVAVELGGTTLTPGVYGSPTFGLTGTLTLNAQGNPNAQFIFQASSTIITASNSRVVLINGAQACNVVWQIGSSATFNTDTAFVGNVLAHTSISALTGATFKGRLLARVGAVTLDHNTITRANCAAVKSSPSPSPSSTVTSKPTTSPSTPATPGGGLTTTPTPAPTGPGHGPSITPTPHTPTPHLPFTGLPTEALLLTALGLFVLGTASLVAGRRRRR
jgi:LPXTG-motif cell wall-anchored protein